MTSIAPTTVQPLRTSLHPDTFTPAADLAAKYSAQFKALGAASVEVLGADKLQLVFHNNFAGVQAAGAFKEAVDGVQLLVSNQAMTADYWESTAEHTSNWLKNSKLVQDVQLGETHPAQMRAIAATMEDATALSALLRTTIGDGSSLSFIAPRG